MAAPKGNKYAEGNEGGRPPFFTDPLEMESKINEYFNNCSDKKDIVVGLGTIEIEIPTICGLAYFLGFESRQSLFAYEQKEEFSYLIKRARLRIEMRYEQNLSSNNVTGSIFALKNMNWHDKTEIDHTTGGDKINITFIRPDES
jgi:hypothetical protein